MCGVAFAAAMIAAVPVAKGIDAATRQLPVTHVNRAAKGDMLTPPRSIAIKVHPAPTAPAAVGRNGKPQIMDGCEPAFSPVTMPSMAHIAGRCIG
jgi:hypothetical protein